MKKFILAFILFNSLSTLQAQEHEQQNKTLMNRVVETSKLLLGGTATGIAGAGTAFSVITTTKLLFYGYTNLLTENYPRPNHLFTYTLLSGLFGLTTKHLYNYTKEKYDSLYQKQRCKEVAEV